MSCTSFSVDLLVVTPDQLRKIDLMLAKACNDDGSVVWTMNFGLQERQNTTVPFADLVKLAVVLKPALHDKAEATALKGLDAGQTSAAFVAGDTASLFKQGQVSKRRAQSDAQDVIASRSNNSPTA
ncbi:MAG TPA: hypothetical protein VNS63_11110 [Blastocatellia bacterium]|nr:hypothetical protein [Blastocatellia bacterium]